jgi:hypothetical protein
MTRAKSDQTQVRRKGRWFYPAAFTNFGLLKRRSAWWETATTDSQVSQETKILQITNSA